MARRNEADAARVPASPSRPALSPNARLVLERRYLLKDARRRVVETPDALFWRVARAVAAGDAVFDPRADVGATARRFHRIMRRLEFLPNSPTLMNAGTPLGQLMACFVLPVEDSLESIFGTLRDAACIQQSGGGAGYSFSRLRPAGDVVMTTKGTASGPVSFMTIFDRMTEVMKQGSTRRGANMGILRVDHPDICEFITCKRDRGQLTNFNLSVAVPDTFMAAVAEDATWALVHPVSGAVVRRVRARAIWDLLVEMAWENGEPGVIYLDRVNRDNPTPQLGAIEATNPCSEQPLLPYEACCLGSIDLAKMLADRDGLAAIDYPRLGRVVRTAVHFLDNVIEVNRYPLPETERMCRGNRKIGLGIMGLADLFIRLGIPYNSPRAEETAEAVMRFVHERARAASAELAERRGVFPSYRGSVYDRPGGPRPRNATVTTVAPTGTISLIANCSSGIEPIFALAYVRHILEGEELPAVHALFKAVALERGFYSDALMRTIAARGSVQGLADVPADVQRVFVTALDIEPEWHVRIQAAIQRHTDNGVSKTVNLPADATVEDARRAFMLAYELGCKGVTVYRYGSRASQVLSLSAHCLECGADALPGTERGVAIGPPAS
ncbi:MAG TPA: adenosylcobalamin-dependent ribonucleoside-diphosphate reductase [Chloroflexota bacterium]|nr:adenosylcobalamin-dependent ribonucleoside-diphosphate reductase [Chloroflexota bacterium]